MVNFDNAQLIAVNFVKDKKNVMNVTIATTENKEGVWVVRGTCPIDLDGHPWRESFEIVVDQKGNVKTSDFQLM
jgi:hypothetical protein